MEDEKSLDYKQILWVEPTGFMDKLQVDVRERVKDNSKVSGQNH